VSRTAAFYMAVVATAALAVGFYLAKGLGAQGDLVSTIRKIAPIKRARNHNMFVAVSVLVIGLLLLYRIVLWRHK
jgi:hypothetical protein